MRKETQADHVAEDQGYKPEETSRRVTIPGIQTLHQKTTYEIAEVLATVLRSAPNVVEVRYRLGEYIELVSED